MTGAQFILKVLRDPVGAGLPAIAMVNSLPLSLASQLPQGPRTSNLKEIDHMSTFFANNQHQHTIGQGTGHADQKTQLRPSQLRT